MPFEVSFVDESTSLEHHGVMGMKWGVRKDGKPQGFQSGGKDPSKRKVRKSIKKAYKAQRKAGKYNTVGSNVAEVDKQVRTAYKNDAERNAALKESNQKLKKLQDAEAEYDAAQANKDAADRRAYDSRSIYDQVSESGTASQRDNAKRDYKRDRKAADAANEAFKEKEEAYNKAEEAYDEADSRRADREYAIAKTFKEQHLNAAVKDIGFEDVEQGRRLLKEYGLEDYALNPSYFARVTNRTGVRNV